MNENISIKGDAFMFSQSLIVNGVFYFFYNSTQYSLSPMKDLSAFELYHISEMKAVASHNLHNSVQASDYLFKYMNEHELQRHFATNEITDE